MGYKVLVVDDDSFIVEILKKRLTSIGHEVFVAQTAAEGIRLAYKQQPDLAILDIVLPDLDGFEVCRILSEFAGIPVIFLSAKASTQDIIRGLQSGAEDYVRKPFSIAELEERIRVVMRRTNHKNQEIFTYDDTLLAVDLEMRRVTYKNAPLRLSSKEFKLLGKLVINHGNVVSSKELLLHVWGPGYENALDCLNVYIHHLRQKLADGECDHEYIHTEWGVGYRFVPFTHPATETK